MNKASNLFINVDFIEMTVTNEQEKRNSVLPVHMNIQSFIFFSKSNPNDQTGENFKDGFENSFRLLVNEETNLPQGLTDNSNILESKISGES